MGKSKNPFRAGSCAYKIFAGDWEGKTLKEIALTVGSTPMSVYGQIKSIKAKTGYRILYRKLPGDTRSKKRAWHNVQRWYVKNKNDVQNCETCWNFDCHLLQKRKAVAWRNCGGYMPESEEVEDS